LRRAHIDSGQLKAILRLWAAALGVAAAIRLAVRLVLGNWDSGGLPGRLSEGIDAGPVAIRSGARCFRDQPAAAPGRV